jgi:isoquinoline 1-oxidoreductase beta subunit
VEPTQEPQQESARIRISRRAFLGLTATAVGLGLGLFPACSKARSGGTAPPVPATGLQANAFVHIAPDGTVAIVCARSEMGQGVRSSLPVLIADELGADMGRVKIVQGDGDAVYGDQNTDGSSSVRKRFADLRYLGATARTMLIAVAAARWGVPATACDAVNHQVVHAASGRALGFGELAGEAAQRPVPAKSQVTLRPLSALPHLATQLPLVDGPAIVRGQAVFGADVKLPGMLTAVVLRPPVVGGRVVRFDPSRALAVPGVRRVVELPAAKAPYAFKPLGGLAVVADHTWAALRGRAALAVTWEDGDNVVYDSTAYQEVLTTAIRAPGKVVRKVGDSDKALAAARRRVEAEYHVPHLAHAPMEPPAATVRLDGNRCEVWTSTQNPQAARKEVARALGLNESEVTVHVTLLGGGFGRKSKPDYVVEAALVARAAGAPVRLQWTREDDIQHDYYHTVSAQRIVAGLDAQGKITAWHHRTAYPPIGSTFKGTTFSDEGELQQGILDLPLHIPNVRFENCEARAHARIGWLRSVANIYHAFAAQSFIDELAHARGLDPRANLLEVIGPPRIVKPSELGVDKLPNYGQSLDEYPVDTARLRRVIERVTELAGWDQRKAQGRSLGLAAHRSFLTYVAVVMSVVRSPSGKLAVDEAWIVADPGTIVNRERVQAQLEGAVIFGMSIALYGAITMKGGATEQTNFRDYRLVRIAEAPRQIHTEILPSSAPPGGIGEPGVPPVAPALANAVFALTGERARALPLARSLHA